MKVGAWVWQFDTDYPGSEPDDTKLPISHVLFKTHDADTWMGRYDKAGVKGPDDVKRRFDGYAAEGISALPWCVVAPPELAAIDAQLAIAEQVIDICGGLVLDIEPYTGFAGTPEKAKALVDEYLIPLRTARLNATLIVSYDPRHPDDIDLPRWLQQCNGAAPQCYWRTFAGQGDWGDPAKSVRAALAQVASNVLFVPALQGDAPASEIEAAIGVMRMGAMPYLWRRGLVAAETWAALAAVAEPSAPAPPAPPPAQPPTAPPAPSVEDQVKADIAQLLSVYDKAILDLTAEQAKTRGALGTLQDGLAKLSARVDALASVPAAPVPAPAADAPEYYTVQSGDYAGKVANDHRLTLFYDGATRSWGGTLVALNPTGPQRSSGPAWRGDYNIIFPGDVFRVK